MSPVLSSIVPVFLMIALGATLQRRGFFSKDFAQGLTKLVYWVGIPCLLLSKLTEATFVWGPVARIVLVFLGGSVGAILAGLAIARWQGFERPSVGVFVQACYRGNLGFVGLPVVLVAGASMATSTNSSHGALAILMLAPIAPLYNIFAVPLLLRYQDRPHDHGGPDLKGQLTREMLTNPVVVSAMVGLLLGVLGYTFWGFFLHTLESLGRIAIPLALLSMGALCVQVPLQRGLRTSLWASGIKLFLTPLLGLALAWLLGLNADQARIALLYLATPTSVSSFILAEQLGGDRDVALNAVVLSTAFSVLSLSAVIWLTECARWSLWFGGSCS